MVTFLGVGMKKTALLFLFALIVVFGVAAQQYDDEGDFRVSLCNYEREVQISGYVGGKQIVNIPPVINGLPVTRIRGEAFRSAKVTSVNIPLGVTTIDRYAFYGCKLTSVTIPPGVRSIGESAFEECRSLVDVAIPSSVRSMGEWVFSEWGEGQTVNVEGHADEVSADGVWGAYWRRGCRARIEYGG
jgi:hypothetical protein